MSTRPLSPRFFPGFVPLVLLGGVLTFSWAVTPNIRSQAPSAPAALNTAAVSDLVTKIKAQQDLIVANQTKIEAQTALLKEEVRQAKIFAGRGGGHR